jgi:hypothetical protein
MKLGRSRESRAPGFFRSQQRLVNLLGPSTTHQRFQCLHQSHRPLSSLQNPPSRGPALCLGAVLIGGSRGDGEESCDFDDHIVITCNSRDSGPAWIGWGRRDETPFAFKPAREPRELWGGEVVGGIRNVRQIIS